MNKKPLLSLMVCLFTTIIFAQNCPEPKEESFKKVISNAFWKDYKKCPVTVTAEFYVNGIPQLLKKPSKYRKKMFFQVVVVGGEPTDDALGGGKSGIPCIIDKDHSDLVFELKKGNKIKMTGTTFRQRFMGTEIGNYFIVEKIEKVTD